MLSPAHTILHQQFHQQQHARHQQSGEHFQQTYQYHENYDIDGIDDVSFEYLPVPTEVFSSNIDIDNLSGVVKSFSSDPMQSGSWDSGAQFTPKLGRFSHHRESSLSSLGSAGPASPFNSQTTNPQIAISDSIGDSFTDMHPHDMGMSSSSPYYQLSKPMAPFPTYHNLDNAPITEMAYPVTIPGPRTAQKTRNDRTLLPAPDFSGSSSRSHPTSVASSIAGDSPATPTVGDIDTAEIRRPGHGNAPKLDRTMTDVYGDELYNPNFSITSSSPPRLAHRLAPHSNDVFNQRISAANNQHLHTVRHSPISTTSRDMSPFRNGSPLAPSPLQDWTGGQGPAPFNSAQHIREQNKVRQETRFLQQHDVKTESRTPQTISPKDAMLEFTEPDEETTYPLFPQSSSSYGMDQFGRAVLNGDENVDGRIPGFGPLDNGGQLGNISTQIQQDIQIPQQYPFVAQTRAGHEELTSRFSSTGPAGAPDHTPAVQRPPEGARAEKGTYTCTYHGCTLRFETPTLLQKHKREGHRQTHGLNGARSQQEAGMTSSLLNSQAGPHRCERVNPSTGKPCNTVFSRPYDLTRHEDTIHNARKQKVHCNLCTEEKTFSRADALTRHYRVCHPDIELPGKHRRRGAM